MKKKTVAGRDDFVFSARKKLATYTREGLHTGLSGSYLSAFVSDTLARYINASTMPDN